MWTIDFTSKIINQQPLQNKHGKSCVLIYFLILGKYIFSHKETYTDR